MTPCCETCRFFFVGENDRGACRRFPPATFLTLSLQPSGTGVQFSSSFPPMGPEGWCGEWAAKRELIN